MQVAWSWLADSDLASALLLRRRARVTAALMSLRCCCADVPALLPAVWRADGRDGLAADQRRQCVSGKQQPVQQTAIMPAVASSYHIVRAPVLRCCA
jgi:hypothetical protein